MRLPAPLEALSRVARNDNVTAFNTFAIESRSEFDEKINPFPFLKIIQVEGCTMLANLSGLCNRIYSMMYPRQGRLFFAFVTIAVLVSACSVSPGSDGDKVEGTGRIV